MKSERRDSSHDDILSVDKADLMALITMRFQAARSSTVAERVAEIDNSDVLERLILVAANAATWEIFVEELADADQSFRISLG